MSREKEERMLNRLKDPDESKDETKDIANLIDSTIKNGNTVWLMTDWHLWRRDKKGSTKCHKRDDFNKIMNNIKETVKDNDLLINLGDLVDGEFTGKEELKEALLSIGKNMILVRGNNDLFDRRFYKSCGFKYVVDSFVWKDILFTHMPIKNDNNMNVHGHIHGYRTYWIPYQNHIDVGAYEGRIKPVKLKSIITKQKEYAKTIKEDPSHFNEYAKYQSDSSLIFMSAMLSLDKVYMPDPFED